LTFPTPLTAICHKENLQYMDVSIFVAVR